MALVGDGHFRKFWRDSRRSSMALVGIACDMDSRMTYREEEEEQPPAAVTTGRSFWHARWQGQGRNGNCRRCERSGR